eukprot:CAMPEP_0184486586 /NCGR_PEP_ID=MMETSP0113_2-20130426/8068_1 /TAXON_ID=91329 /ORGANISM="Norrisiella sphaerica, Strain BC52" /LENGTH=160 /DNA_ID=CAMNT_0026868533 /DNA_START=173 /DNA_END=652 /DNA_ORIENTATION=+
MMLVSSRILGFPRLLSLPLPLFLLLLSLTTVASKRFGDMCLKETRSLADTTYWPRRFEISAQAEKNSKDAPHTCYALCQLPKEPLYLTTAELEQAGVTLHQSHSFVEAVAAYHQLACHSSLLRTQHLASLGFNLALALSALGRHHEAYFVSEVVYALQPD